MTKTGKMGKNGKIDRIGIAKTEIKGGKMKNK